MGFIGIMAHGLGTRRIRPGHALLLLMLVSFLLRLVLIANGGQRFAPDEYRYYRGTVKIADTFYAGDIIGGISSLLEYRTHPGSYAATLLPALIHRAVFALIHGQEGSWLDYWEEPLADFRVSSLIFALPSVLSIGLLYRIAKRAGADEAEALLAAFFLATSTTWFIYSRHFLSYDISMLFALLALYCGLRAWDSDINGALLTGALLFCAFWIYTNHFFLVGVIGLLYCFVFVRGLRVILHRLIFVSLGAAALFLPILLFNHTALGINALAGLLEQRAGITQGEYAEGLILPFLYFRDAEGLISLVWMIGLLLAAKDVMARGNAGKRVLHWFIALLSLYLFMAALSSGAQFVVLFGRTTRVMTPFIALICAYAFAPYLRSHGYKTAALFALVLSVFAYANFAAAINLRFSRDIIRQAQEDYGPLSFASTFTLPSGVHLASFRHWLNSTSRGGRYVLVNAGFHYPITEMTERPAGEVLMKVAHPFNYRPYQYEGMTAAMREIIRRDGLYIWLIDTGAPAE